MTPGRQAAVVTYGPSYGRSYGPPSAAGVRGLPGLPNLPGLNRLRGGPRPPGERRPWDARLRGFGRRGLVQGGAADVAPAAGGARDEPTLKIQLNALQALCRQVFGFRLAMIALAAPIALGRTEPGPSTWLVGSAVVVTFMVSYVLFRDWERFGPMLLRHPSLLAADMLFGALLLITATPESTLAFVTVCTPLLAGLVYGWTGAGFFAGLQILILAGVYAADPELDATGLGFLLLPGFCVVAGAVGVSLRNLMFRFGTATQALTEARARLAVAEAVAEERARLAREMHDSVAKTLHGLALAADGLAASAVRAEAGQRAAAAEHGPGARHGTEPGSGAGPEHAAGPGGAGGAVRGDGDARTAEDGERPRGDGGDARGAERGRGDGGTRRDDAVGASLGDSRTVPDARTDIATVRRQAGLVARSARRAAAETRELLSDLRRESGLDGAGVQVTDELPARVADFSRRTGLPAVFERLGTAPVPSVPHAVARQLLTIVSEALDNAHLHARATHVSVEAGITDGTLLVSVVDDGRGLPAGTNLQQLRKAGHFGLVGMVERASAIGARIRIGAGPRASGTEVRLELPVSALLSRRGRAR
ncbi:sensor histidine kinase [Streptomyces sp. NPDC048639]|uniref:sensor histidine kinase n=1 Tax=Streptomyces sp. NPDC048639 TaxID=3365581 RepID=UPI003717B470